MLSMAKITSWLPSLGPFQCLVNKGVEIEKGKYLNIAAKYKTLSQYAGLITQALHGLNGIPLTISGIQTKNFNESVFLFSFFFYA